MSEKAYKFDGLSSGTNRSSLKARLRGFTFSFFTINMGTAGFAYILARIPPAYQCDGLNILGRIILIFDLVVFSVFSAAIIARFYLYPRAMITCFRHPVEASYVCAFAQACATIMVAITAYAPEHVGEWINTVLLVLYFMQLFFAIFLAITIPLVHFGLASRSGNVQKMPPSWLLLPTVVTYTASLSYNIANLLPATQAVYVLWTGYMMLGLGIMLTIPYFVLWFTSLAMNGVPRGRYALTPFMIVGMSSYISGGFLGLGHAAVRIFAEYSEDIGRDYLPGDATLGGVLVQNTASGTFHLFNLSLGLLFYGWAWWTFLVACTMSIYLAIRGEKGSFQPSISSYWSLIFPTTGLILDTWDLAEALQETAGQSGIRWMDIIGIVLFGIWVFAYCTGWAFVLMKIFKKEALYEGKDDNKPDFDYRGEFHPEASEMEMDRQESDTSETRLA